MNSNEYNILNLFERENKPLFFREISKKSKVSIGGTQKALSNYSDFFDKEVKGRNTYYFFRPGVLKIYLKKLIEIERMIRFTSKNKILKEFLLKLNEMKIPSLIFGSYASNTNKKTSDLDLVVLSDVELPEYLCPVELHIIRATKKEFRKSMNLNDDFSKEILKNHIIINGIDYFSEVFN